MRQIVGNGGLRRHGRGNGGHQLQPGELLGVAAGDPADPVAGRQALGKRTAMHHQAFAIVALHRLGRLSRVKYSSA